MLRTKLFSLIFLLFSSLISTSTYAKTDTEKVGDVLQLLIPAIAYGTTFYLDDKAGRSQFYYSLLTTAAITQTLKLTIDKKRPNGGSQSFPSGHTSSAFQGAAFIHKRYGFKKAIAAYVGATYVAYSRVYAKKHFVEDVVAGAALGIATNYYFVTPYKGFNITPTASNGRYGISISKKW